MITAQRIKAKHLSMVAAVFIVSLLLGTSGIVRASDDSDYDSDYDSDTSTTVSLPEPGTLSLLAIGLAGAAWLGRRKGK